VTNRSLPLTPFTDKLKRGKMEEQKELDELKRLMTEQQSKLANTMAEMELKASTLQEKLDKKSEGHISERTNNDALPVPRVMRRLFGRHLP
jgi:hypothetical protein